MYLEECTCYFHFSIFRESVRTTENLHFCKCLYIWICISHTHTHNQFISIGKDKQRIVFPPPLPFQLKDMNLCHMKGQELKKWSFFPPATLCWKLHPPLVPSEESRLERLESISLLLLALLSIICYLFCIPLNPVHTSIYNPFKKFSSTCVSSVPYENLGRYSNWY